MTFEKSTYDNLISEASQTQARVFPQYRGTSNEFDIVIVGSGIGGGVLADDLADRSAGRRRILILEAGSFLLPTHVYNVSRIPNTALAPRFACKTFWQAGNESSQNYIHERPQLNFGGRSIFWSGLIPHLQDWELGFLPPRVRDDLRARYLASASQVLNESVTLGSTAQEIVAQLRQSDLAEDFDIRETPRALHQPYLNADGTPRGQYFVEPTGVFNTAELLIDQLGPTGSSDEGPGLFLLLNHYVEDIRAIGDDRFELVARNALSGEARIIGTTTAVLAAGSLESPKLLRRSTLFPSLQSNVRAKVGVGLTDHPTTDSVQGLVSNIGRVPIPRDSSAKIVFYSRGRRSGDGGILFPFNVEMNVNHEYWHLRENDSNAPRQPLDHSPGSSIIDIKFSFGNCLDEGNEIKPALPFAYVPEVVFRNQKLARSSGLVALPGPGRVAQELRQNLRRLERHHVSDLPSVSQLWPRTAAVEPRLAGNLVRRKRHRLWFWNRAPRRRNPAHALLPVSHASSAIRFSRRRRSAPDRHTQSVRLRHVRLAVRVSGQPRAFTRRARATAIHALRLSSAEHA